MSQASAILTLLLDGDEPLEHNVMSHLRGDPLLLHTVWMEACQSEIYPRKLSALILDEDGDDIVAQYKQTNDLESGIWLLPRIEWPRINHQERGLRLLRALGDRLAASNNPYELAKSLRDDYGFAGNKRDYYHPYNSYMNKVLETRLGLPISLTVLWILLARQKDWPVDVIALPGHVIGHWDGIYIDLFNEVKPLAQNDVFHYCQQVGALNPNEFLKPASDRQLLQRMALNLIMTYQSVGDTRRASLAAAMAS